MTSKDGKISAALALVRSEIAEQTALMAENKNTGEEGLEELLKARRNLAAELREDLRLLGEEEEDPWQEQEGKWVDHEGSPESETELVILGLGMEFDDYVLASMLGGGLKVRWITTTPMDVFVAYHKKEDATEGLTTVAPEIIKAGGPRTSVKRARFNMVRHSHEADMNGPQPRYIPYPTTRSEVTGMWTDYGHNDEEIEEAEGWKDYSKVDKWTTREWKTSVTETTSSTGASSSTTYTDTDPEEARARKRARGS
jgi:hypothetical protein